ncbi:glycoside hydrolase family 43 protein [Actinacidiphila sp. ITFR-21]|uniref:glycoside hydrolase family 43 protein n=1 Tax=Actinacidiphila sp. ITFR-21 TaxID=3075199 RepID=UPI00288B3F42|nr:glycoside hydrolase family 43 protein [Streptomyces sp. ITFR-21]WNI18039.1 glycoside hydrolase family 43 protein [Streptomyces sp. ITFR-21]
MTAPIPLGRPGRVLIGLLLLLTTALAFGPPVAAASGSGRAGRQQPYGGYLFAYFTGESTADGEQIHLALSQGNDPLHWRELGGGAPVLTSVLGEKGVRDPSIIRSPRGDKFYLLATDLKIYGNGDWDTAQRHGSRSIMVWESSDLVHWSEQRSVQVSPQAAGNTWAPEAFWDARRHQYMVFWSSELYAKDDSQHTAASHERIMYATTRDFQHFTPARVWDDPGHSVIDSTVVADGRTYYRFTKDERDPSADAPCGKYVFEEKATDLLAPSWKPVAECIGKAAQGGPGIVDGEGPTVFKSNTAHTWYAFIDEFTDRGYVPFETTDLGSGQWTMSSDYELPASPRHGTVVPITRAEYNRLAARWHVSRMTAG